MKPFHEKYDSQFILYFEGDDKAAEENAEALVAKAHLDGVLDKTTVITLSEPKGSATYNLSENKPLARGRVRVYIVGHGTETSSTVGGCNAKHLAATINTLSDFKIQRVSIVACHAGGDGNKAAPHRFASDLWDHVKGFVVEVTGYTGTVHLDTITYKNSGNPAQLPKGAVRYKSWSGAEWWVTKGTGKKVVGHEHDESANRRKVYFTEHSGVFSKGWTGEL
jgi:hypothetical protein